MNRLAEIEEQIAQQKQPPVHRWNPEHVGEIDIRIDANGFWFHEGDPIERDALVSLFASILWYEEGRYYLVTPVEKLRISVDDVPFMIHQAEFADGKWVVVTNTHEQFLIGGDNPVSLRNFRGAKLPYIRIRYDLWARPSRSVYYQWIESAMQRSEASDDEALVLFSGDYRIDLA